MTETTDADAIRTMPPDALRRWLFSALGGTEDAGEMDILHISWQGRKVQTTWYEENPLDLIGVPAWPSDLASAWSLVLEHCADPDGHATFQIFTLPDGRVEVFDGRATVLSSLRQMKDYEVTSYPGLTGPMALADALSRLCALAIREKEVEG